MILVNEYFAVASNFMIVYGTTVNNLSMVAVVLPLLEPTFNGVPIRISSQTVLLLTSITLDSSNHAELNNHHSRPLEDTNTIRNGTIVPAPMKFITKSNFIVYQISHGSITI